MKKILKRVLIGFGIFLAVLLLAAFLVPILFKDQIKNEVDKQIALYVNADVNFGADDFSVSLFKDFPNVSASLNNLSVVNRAPFKGDTLASFKSFRVSIDLFSLFGEEMKINGVALIQPRIFGKINKEGVANWDIYREQPITDTTKTKEPVDTTSKFSLRIHEWKIENGYVVYDDRTSPMYVKIENLNHKGSGALEDEVFDLFTKTEIEKFDFEMDGASYLADKKITADVTMGMDMKNAKYTFKNNEVRLNDFALKFDGFIAMPDTNITMDIKYATLENDFKTILSLVPGMFTESFKDVKTTGKVEFNGDVKGTFNAVQMPGFQFNLKVSDAMFQYPSVPTPVNNIALDLAVANDDGNLDNTKINLKVFHMDLGKNPVDAKAIITGLGPMNIDASLKAALNLADVSKMFPMEGLQLAGLFNVDGTAKGRYDGTTMPVVKAKMQLQNGFVKSKDFPAPLEKINLQATAQSDGTMPNSEFGVQNFSMVLEGEPITATAYFKNFDDIEFNVKAKGSADLTKMTKIYPLEGMKLSGKVKADITTQGRMSYITAEQYDKIPTSGLLEMKDFVYETADMPAVKIDDAHLTFNPQEMVLDRFSGFAGRSDMSVTGTIKNYMGYLFRGQTIQGKFKFDSKKFDVNEWLVDSPEQAPANPAPTQEVPMTVFEVPKNIDFLLNSSIGEVVYDNLSLKQMTGDIIVKEGIVNLQDLTFNTLGGAVVMNGEYNTQNIAKPSFNFDFGVKDMSVAEAAQSFVTLKAMAPIVENITGKFSTKFKMNGLLGSDMMPQFNTLSGEGLITLINGALSNVPVLTQIAEKTKMNELKNMQLANILMKAQITNGRFAVEPFDVKYNEYIMQISGSNGIADGSLAYNMKMDVPTKAVGQQVSQSLSQLTGFKVASLEKIPVVIQVGGTYKKPVIQVRPGDVNNPLKATVESKKEELTNQFEQELEKKKQEAEAKAKQEADRLKAEAEAKAKQEAERLKQEAADKAKRVADSIKKAAEKKLKDKFKFP